MTRWWKCCYTTDESLCLNRGTSINFISSSKLEGTRSEVASLPPNNPGPGQRSALWGIYTIALAGPTPGSVGHLHYSPGWANARLCGSFTLQPWLGQRPALWSIYTTALAGPTTGSVVHLPYSPLGPSFHRPVVPLSPLFLRPAVPKDRCSPGPYRCTSGPTLSLNFKPTLTNCNSN